MLGSAQGERQCAWCSGVPWVVGSLVAGRVCGGLQTHAKKKKVARKEAGDWVCGGRAVLLNGLARWIQQLDLVAMVVLDQESVSSGSIVADKGECYCC